MITLKEWVGSGDCPWALGTAQIYAWRALKGERRFRHLPFRQDRPGATIFVDPQEMASAIFRRRKGGK